MSRIDHSSLISAIYAATLAPRDFDRTFDTLDGLLFEAADLASGEETARVVEAGRMVEAFRNDPDILTHIELAREIQSRVGRQQTPDRKLAGLLDAVPNPSWFIDQSGAVVAANELASAKLGRKARLLGDCVADPGAEERIRAFIKSRDREELLVVADYFDPARKSQTSVLVKRVSGDLLDGQPGALFLLTVVDFGFDEQTRQLFRDTYGLTDAESRIAVLLASGLPRAEIAVRRGVSVDTVNTQIKTIKQKTTVRDIPALVRLLCGFSASLLATPGMQSTIVASDVGSLALRTSHHLILKDGRRLEYLEQGVANGRPVLLFHNLPYGADLPEAAIRRARRDNLRFIAPYRPGSGDTSSAGNVDNDAYVSQTAGDAEELLAHLGIERAALVAHTIGVPYALRFASLFPERVSAMIAVARAPIWRDEWISRTPQRQRMIQRLARHFPKLLPVVAWSMIACLERGFAREFVVYACKDGPADSVALANTETLDLIVQGSIDGMRHGTEAFCRDSVASVTDFTGEAKSCPHKFHILHGADDRIVDVSQSMAFVEEVPGSTLEIVERAGQLLFYSHWQRVMDAVLAKLEQPEKLSA